MSVKKNIQTCKKLHKHFQIAEMQKIAIFLKIDKNCTKNFQIAEMQKIAIFLKIDKNRSRDFPEGQYCR